MTILGKNISKKTLIIAAVVALIGGIIAFILFDKNKDDKKIAELKLKEAEASPTTTDTESNQPSTTTTNMWANCNDNFPLQFGSCGPRVKVLQYWLKNTCGISVGVHGYDGKMGADTVAAVMKKKGLGQNPEKDFISESYWLKMGLDKIVLPQGI